MSEQGRSNRGVAALAAVGVMALAAAGCGGEPPPEPAAIRVSAASGPTTEAGGEARFSIVLGGRPSAAVTLHLDSSNTAEGVVDPTELTFTPDTWSTPQTVKVRGIDDAVRDGPQDYQVVFSPATSEDGRYAGQTPEPVALTNRDDEKAGLDVKLSGSTSEKGDQATLRVVLTSEPRGEVTVSLRSTDTAEGVLDIERLSFTPVDWQVPQTVVLTGVDDEVADGQRMYVVELTPSSNDPNYGGAPIRVDVPNVDDDTAGITVSEASGPTSEGGDVATFTVALTSRPVSNVVVDLTSSLPTEGVPSVASLTFTPDDWKTPRTVQVVGVDDLVADGDQAYSITVSSVTSEDADYASLAPAIVLLTNTDDDTPGIKVGKPSGPTSEMGEKATFTVVLTSQPTGAVTVAVESSDETEGTVRPKSLIFTPLDWAKPQKVTVQGVLDTITDGDQPYEVSLTLTSADPAYAALEVPEVALVNLDTVGFCQPLTFSGFKCPSGAAAWCSPTPISPFDEAQAKAACEACYGAPCERSAVDCAGPAYGPQAKGKDSCGQAFFGFTPGCFGGAPGRVFPLCNSNKNLGRWAP